MKPSKILLKAAKLIDSDKAHCPFSAIYEAYRSIHNPRYYEPVKYLSIMKSDSMIDGLPLFMESKSVRVLALLFASSIAASEGF